MQQEIPAINKMMYNIKPKLEALQASLRTALSRNGYNTSVEVSNYLGDLYIQIVISLPDNVDSKYVSNTSKYINSILPNYVYATNPHLFESNKILLEVWPWPTA